MGHTPSFRIGHGYDCHKLAPLHPAGEGKPLVLGGVALPSDLGPVAHSDGDALLHAITDAVLGAICGPDIGQLFPNTESRNAGRDSTEFLAAAVARARELGFRVVNLDATVVLQEPKLSPHKEAIRRRLAPLLGVSSAFVNVKGKTGEGVGAVGRREAVEAHAVVLLIEDAFQRE